MFVLGLLTCIVLRAFSAQAKVVENFNECSKFFYRDTEPQGMDQNNEKICQKLENMDFFYATMYSIPYKIPLYSAYTLDPACSVDRTRPNIWHLEPQISKSTDTDHMVRENQDNQNELKENQAVSSDYTGSGYDRGHLNPNSFQCGEGRTATFTLTNAAPMDPCFNRYHWSKWEMKLRSYLIKNLVRDGISATAFIVTGTVPHSSTWLPRRTPEEPVRVNVPSYIWTAVCYKHNIDSTKSFSFGFIGRNQPTEPDIRLMSVSDLNVELSYGYSLLSRSTKTIKIFVDECSGIEYELSKYHGIFQKLINLPGSEEVQIRSGTQNTYLAMNGADCGDSISEFNNNIEVSQMTVKLAFDSMSTYYNVLENLKAFAGSVCLLTYIKPQVRKMHHELRKREVSKGSDTVECLLVPEKQKTAADGSLCSKVTESSYSCQCDTGSETKPCCCSPCLYQDKVNGYKCYSGQNLIECSPLYSLINYKGKRCLDDHPCGTYGKDYYWCQTTADSWEYCSPPLWTSKTINGKYCRSNFACAMYGYKYTWCYTDENDNNDKCCTSDDCHSAVNHKICRPNHKCGYHGYKYLWCYTDYKGSWDYCCTDCG